MKNLWYGFYLFLGVVVISLQSIVIDTIEKDCASFENPEKLSKNDWRYNYLTFMNYAVMVFGAAIIAYSTYQKFAVYGASDLLYDFSERRDDTIWIHTIQGAIALLLIMYASVMFDVARNYCKSEQKWRNPVMLLVASLSLATGVYLLFNIYWVRRAAHKTRKDLKKEKIQKLRKYVEEEDPELYLLVQKSQEEAEEISEKEWEKEHKRESLRQELEDYEGATKAQRERKEKILERFGTGTKTDTLEKQIEKLFESGSGRTSKPSRGAPAYPFRTGRRGFGYTGDD